MASKLKLISDLYNETIDIVTSDSEKWQSFLKCASNNYKYNFSEQLLIYAQKPNAVACADIDTWNKVLKRWVNKGASGIALLNDDKGYLKLRYVFDVSDTHSKYGKNVSLWKVDRKYDNELIESLENKYGELSKKETLQEALISTAINLTDDNYTDYFNELLNNRIGTKLEHIEEYLLDETYKDLLANSIAFVLLNRCGIDPMPYFENDDFVDIKDFNHIETITRLGSAISEISEMGLREIYNTLKNIKINEIEKNRTFDSNKNIVYDEITKEENAERRDDYEHSIQENRELRTTKSWSKGESEYQARQVFNDEIRIPKESQKESVSDTNDARLTYRASDGNREYSTRENNINDRTDEEIREHRRELEEDRPDEVGRFNEQHQELSGRDSNQRTNLQLETYDPTNKVSQYVVLDEKINQILSKTPHLHKTNKEIKSFFKNEEDKSKRIEFLKETFNNDYTGIIVDDQMFGYKAYDNGIFFWKGNYLTREAESFVSWNDILYHYDAMILLKQLDDIEIKEKSQLSLFDSDIETKKTTNSDIEFTQDFIDTYLISRHKKTKFDIYENFKENDLINLNALYLKESYGIGGESSILRGSGIGISHNAKGIEFQRGHNDASAIRELFSWNYIARRIRTLIEENRYLSVEEFGEYHEKKKQTEKEYDYKVGDKVFIESREFQIEEIDDFDITLLDLKLPLLNRVMNIVEFESKLPDNPYNDYLKVIKDNEELDIEEDNELELEIVTNISDLDDEKSFTVARAIDGKNCVELHYTNGKPYIEISEKVSDDRWDGTVEDATWFNRKLTDKEVLEKLEELFVYNFLGEEVVSKDTVPVLDYEEIQLLERILFNHKIHDMVISNDDNGVLVASDGDNTWKGIEIYNFLFDEVINFNDDGTVELISDSDLLKLKEYKKQHKVISLYDKEDIKAFIQRILKKCHYPEGETNVEVDENGKLESVELEYWNVYSPQEFYCYILNDIENGNYDITDDDKNRLVHELKVVREDNKKFAIGKKFNWNNGTYIALEIEERKDDYDLVKVENIITKEKKKLSIDSVILLIKEYNENQNKAILTEKERDIEQAKKVLALFDKKKKQLETNTSQLSLFDNQTQQLADRLLDMLNSLDTKYKDDLYIYNLELKKWDHIASANRNLTIDIKSNKYNGYDDNSFTQFNADKTDEMVIRNFLNNDKFIQYLREDKDFDIIFTPTSITFFYHNFDYKDIDFSVGRDELLEYKETNKKEEVIDELELPIVPNIEVKKKKSLDNYVLHPEVQYEDRLNYVIDDDNLGVGTPKERFKNNIAAIKILKLCERENRYATHEEQEVLSKYVGWGGLAQAFDKDNTSWQEEYYELKELLTDDEYDKAKDTVLTAFYTPPVVIKSMYKALSNMGLEKGNILEPSCGIGNFIGLLPNNDKLKIYGVEIDDISGRIARQLYQKSSIAIKGFEETNYSDSFFDVAIGNVPFGDYPVYDKRYDKNHFMIHDYFFAKTLDKVRPGGVVAFITSKGTMDKTNDSVRKYLAQRADLLGAIRLPNNTFKDSAGTVVTSDILFFQKRDTITDIMPSWVKTGINEDGIEINNYFIEHPEMVLGNIKMISGRFGPESACVPYEDERLEDLLDGAVSNIHAEIKEYELEDLSEETISIEADVNVKNFSYTVIDDKIYYRENSLMYLKELPLTTENRIKGLIELRDCVRELINMQLENATDDEVSYQQKKLNDLYDKFTKKYGLINSRGNSTAFSDDGSYFLLCSLEILNENKELERKADIFYKRTINPIHEFKTADTSSDALILSISEKAEVDLDYMSEVSNIPKDKLISDLEGAIFKVPNEDNLWVTQDEYLSGDIREKLRVAEEYAKDDSSYNINVTALKEVMPEDITTSEINVRFGATWIPPKYYEQFLFEILESSYYARQGIKIHYSNSSGEWYIEGKHHDRGSVRVNTTYGTSRANAYKLFEDGLNLRDTKIFDYQVDEYGKKTPIFNKKETAIAQAKHDKRDAEFAEWIWKDPDRREELTRLYNEKFNSIRLREYDGSHITFDGMNPEIKLRKHQINAIARILYGGNTLLAHEVGAGKTFEMVAAAMESKRLGLCNKSLFVVPNHIIEQFASEFLQLYPSANILVSTKKDFETANRKKFCSRIATGDYDAVIIGHSQFERIPMSVARQRTMLHNQLDEIIDGIEELKRNNSERFTIKQMIRTKKMLEKKLEKLNSQNRKDDVITFEELGVDRLFVDEAHYYKNLFLYTKMRNVAGIAQTEAQKSSDLQMKCRYLDEITGNKGVIFATGTPISNSMVELYTMQRYLQYDTLVKHGLQHFDAWASTFGEKVTAVELAPEGNGYRSKTRFARFYNLPELMNMFKEVADIQTADTLNLPVPKAHYENIVIKPSEIQLEYVKSFSERAEKVRNKEVKINVDNMLKITNDGRKLALDQRLVDARLPDEKDSKVDVCSQNIFKIWEENKENRLTQLVFCDLSTPKNDGTFNVYDDIKSKLLARGVPEEEIQFIHNAHTDAQKKEMFAKVRKGQVRILIGSTPKMGAGTNCQDKLLALHDLDCPWRPSDLIQRSGRIVRQGNQNEDVYIYRYVTEKTFDAYLYQLVENKQKFMSQIMTSKTPVRTAEDIDEVALSYAEIKALAAGNPLILEKTELDTQVAKLKILKQGYLNEKYRLEDQIRKHYPGQIKFLEKRIEAYKSDIEVLKENTKENSEGFSPMTINGVTYTDKKEAGTILTQEALKCHSVEPIELGEYRGFKMEIKYVPYYQQFKLYLTNNMEHSLELGNSSSGNITRIDNLLDDFDFHLNSYIEELKDVEIQFEKAKEEVKKPFTQEQEYKEKTERLNELNRLLNLNEKTHDVVDDTPDDLDNDSQIYKSDYER